MALGTYATPAALLRSGVGPPAELARHGIPAVAELPGVGRGMQDHPKVSYRFDLGLAAPAWPNPWYQCLLTGAHEVDGERRVYQVMPYSGQVEGGQRFTDLNVQVADARSRRGARAPAEPRPGRPAGRSRWAGSSSPATAPRPSPPAGACSRWPAGRRWRRSSTPWPGLDDPDHVLRTVETFHHPVGSCRMGRADDPEAVVDARGRVRGVEGLWIVDASVIARVPSANTHLAVDRPGRAPVRVVPGALRGSLAGRSGDALPLRHYVKEAGGGASSPARTRSPSQWRSCARPVSRRATICG